ncbi:hypothetical protein F5B22DRAFT_506568 [Xylaria bambusicola]|uniref:uncharacterized protein n=1 Tax=Xylaria bambusicola TaxID=326684 RepID=UPI0020078668|nr:uncharacterized protein F5B22DRAFT_506568 [Xylaria bambusicola]KAI0521859.1 hypothetical protein F5B22DRAFT_506568 [Xylaria bambusicola]
MSLAPADLPKEPKCVPPIPVPTYGAGGVFTVACAAELAAPALQCLEKVLDLPHYGSWNTFIPRAEVLTSGPDDNASAPLPPEVQALAARPGFVSPGARIRFDAVMSGSWTRSVELDVSFLEAFDPADGGGKAYRVAWKGTSFPTFLLRSERVQEFVEYVAEDGSVRTKYANWETFGGLLGYVLPREQIVAGFEKWTVGLKKAVEEEVAK